MMKKILAVLVLAILFLTGFASAEESFRVGFSITPFLSKTDGEGATYTFFETVTSGDRVTLDLRIFETVVLIEQYGQKLSFTFDRDLELAADGVTAATRFVTVEEGSTAHLRTPTKDGGADLVISWFPYHGKTLYTDFLLSIGSILNGEPSDRYSSYEDYSIMFNVQSVWPKKDRTLGYALMDIDRDGTDELIFGDMKADSIGTPIYDLYTIRNGEPYHIFDGWDRNRYYLTQSMGFIRQSSSGASNYFNAFYFYTQGELYLERSVIFNMDKDADDPWFLSYFDVNDVSKARQITAEEARTVIGYYIGQQVELTPFP